jgi:hypothetical protein
VDNIGDVHANNVRGSPSVNGAKMSARCECARVCVWGGGGGDKRCRGAWSEAVRKMQHVHFHTLFSHMQCCQASSYACANSVRSCQT